MPSFLASYMVGYGAAHLAFIGVECVSCVSCSSTVLKQLTLGIAREGEVMDGTCHLLTALQPVRLRNGRRGLLYNMRSVK